MSRLVDFICPELNMTYDAVYAELADYLEMDIEYAQQRFAPDDAVARVRYHRRQRQRKCVQNELAEALRIPAEAVYAACGEEGARILLEALRATSASGWTLTVVPAAAAVIDELEDLMAR